MMMERVHMEPPVTLLFLLVLRVPEQPEQEQQKQPRLPKQVQSHLLLLQAPQHLSQLQPLQPHLKALSHHLLRERVPNQHHMQDRELVPSVAMTHSLVEHMRKTMPTVLEKCSTCWVPWNPAS